MRKTKIADYPPSDRFAADSGIIIGRIMQVDAEGRIYVEYSGNTSGPLAARMTVTAQGEISGRPNATGCQVLLVFEENNPDHPIVLGLMHSFLDEIALNLAVDEKAERLKDVIVDGKRVEIDAREEVVLKCGRASITLTSAGKILIEGEYVSSRSKGTHKIKGGSMQIN